MTGEYYLKYQHSCIVNALLENITDNFECVSFKCYGYEEIDVMIILCEITKIEEDCITDFFWELDIAQDSWNGINNRIISTSRNLMPLDNIVYASLNYLNRPQS